MSTTVSYFISGKKYAVALNERWIGNFPWFLVGAITFDLG